VRLSAVSGSVVVTSQEVAKFCDVVSQEIALN
jgi:hypothetical protein